MGYPEELRDEVLGEVLSKNPPVGKLAKEFGISRATIFNWKKEAGLLTGSSRKLNEQSSTKEGLSIKDKLYILKETFHMNELELGEYCRNKGIVSSDLKRWEEEITEPVQDTTTTERISLAYANKKLRKELDRKEKALAEAAALLILSKKAKAIWGEKEDEK